MDPESKTADPRTLLQQRVKCIATIRSVRLRRETFDRISGSGILRHHIRVVPEPKLKVKSAGGCFVADEAQHLKIVIALPIAKRRGSHIVARNAYKKWISKVEIRVCHRLWVVVAKAERQVKAVEA